MIGFTYLKKSVLMKSHSSVTYNSKGQEQHPALSSKQHSAGEELESHTQATEKLLKEAGQDSMAVSHCYILKAASQAGRKLG